VSSDRPILVVEDDDSVRDALCLLLQLEGHQVVTAPNGAVALEVIPRCSPRLILLDLRMPVMDGWTFVRAYRETEGPHVPIVVITAAWDIAASAARLEVAAVLEKPFGLPDLLAAVDQHGCPS
jgi:CheY-like chemotaxis protein